MKADAVQAVLTVAQVAAVRDTLQLITVGADARQAGIKAHLLAFLAGCSPCKTQRELARALGLAPSRVCGMLNVLRRHFKRLG